MTDESDVDEERKTRSDRLSRRFESNDKATPSKTSSTSNTSKTSKTVAADTDTETSQTSQTEQTPVKDRPTVMMYLPDDIKDDLGRAFDQLAARRTLEDKPPIEKNRDFYPALVEVALDHSDEIEEKLDEE